VTDRPLRVMWLLNHTTLRKFEIPQMERLGIREIFLPKSFPYDEGNLSASIDYSKDATLSIVPHELEILNQQNWYRFPSEQAWEIANRHFDVLFMGFFPEQIRSSTRNFKGAIVLHAFGLAGNETYSGLLRRFLTTGEFENLRKVSSRFFFGAGYKHLSSIEDDFIKSRNCFLPVGLSLQDDASEWRGSDKRIFFVCPRIRTTQYFQGIYDTFVENFSEFPFAIGGAQPIPVRDKRVLGFVDRGTHDRNMRELAVMFYHSQEPNHIHYHPFEAIQSGMPLIFMSGGVLDQFGGVALPGRCTSFSEARRKIRQILDGDRDFIESVRRSQTVLLDPMRPQNCAPHWQSGFVKIRQAAGAFRDSHEDSHRRRRRIAIIIPVDYRGGTLRAAKMIAEAIQLGGQQAGEMLEVVLAHLDDPAVYRDEDFADLPAAIRRRKFKWDEIPWAQTKRAALYSGMAQEPFLGTYQVPEDGIQQFMDCDLWLFVSDRLEHPLLELRPYGLFVFDYLTRYEKIHADSVVQPFLDAARRAERVFVTTEFTRRDAIAYAGVAEERVIRLPILAPNFEKEELTAPPPKRAFFLWTTNLAPQKNHENAFRALARYYDVLGGKLRCLVSGVDTQMLMSSEASHLRPLVQIVQRSPGLRKNLKVLGELPDQLYRSKLAQAEFLWHAGRIDNGTFSVVEAAELRVPSLSSDYPAMHEFDETFSLNLQWMNPADPRDMAAALKHMEVNSEELREQLPSRDYFNQQSVEERAAAYWSAVRQCL
jgi:glycosyltransferase involved in cell wall biosynthesis